MQGSKGVYRLSAAVQVVFGLIINRLGSILLVDLILFVLAVANPDFSIAASWTTTGSMNSCRYGHTATLLPNGKVLVAGGVWGSATNSAEIYDPSTGTWTITGGMLTRRAFHTATLLPNGKVFVVGGKENYPTNTTEIYDPSTGTWTAAANIGLFGMYDHTATLLANGKVLVIGGRGRYYYNNENYVCRAAWLYDPLTDVWTFVNNINDYDGIYCHTATLLPGGKVLVAGGRADHVVYNTTYIFDPNTGTFGSEAYPYWVKEEGHTATLLPNGKVLMAGGLNTYARQISEIYEASTNTWERTSDMVYARHHHTATLLSDGNVLVTGGGYVSPSGYVASAEVFNPSSRQWITVESMSFARSQHTATLLPDGRVLVAGGFGPEGYPATAEIFTPPMQLPCPLTMVPSGTSMDLFSIFFLDSQNGWAAGEDGAWPNTLGAILRTTDGGVTWTKYTTTATKILWDAHFVDTQTGWAVGYTGAILKTTDGGVTWTPQTSGTSGNIRDVVFLDSATGWAVGDSGLLLKTVDGGANWVPQTSGTSLDLRKMHFVDETTAWIIGNDGMILKTLDGGVSWVQQVSDTTDNLVSLYFLDASRGWALSGTGTGTLLKTVNGGTTWTATNTGSTLYPNAISFADASWGWIVGNWGMLLQTVDGGATWWPLNNVTGDRFEFYHAMTIKSGKGWIVGESGRILNLSVCSAVGGDRDGDGCVDDVDLYPDDSTRCAQGDYNKDGQVDISDTILALRILAGQSPEGTINLNADVNGNVKIEMAEAIYSLKEAAK